MSTRSTDDFYATLYGELQEEGICGWYVSQSHRSLERHLGPLPTDAHVLELGGNLGEHLRYVNHPFSTYVLTDIRQKGFSTRDPRVKFEVVDAQQLPYEDNTFDRVLMTCLLHHLPDPEQCLREVRRTTKSGGLVSITLPCDPGILYRLSKELGPYRSIKKRSAQSNPRYFHYMEHRNHYPSLKTIVNEVFQDDRVWQRSWPFRTPLWNANLYTIFQVRING